MLQSGFLSGTQLRQPLYDWNVDRWNGEEEKQKPRKLSRLTQQANCRGAANHSRVAEGTRPSPEGVYSGVASLRSI